MIFFYSRISALFAGKCFMAEIRDKLSDNAPGKFFVDSQCIDCDVCRDTSPANFRRNDENGYSYVYKQPETDEERELCEEALNACPVEAIGEAEEDYGMLAATCFANR
jgi:ferredoxin